MKVVGSALLGVERKRVWNALQDPGVLVRTIPGCERLEEVGDDVYKMTVTAGVASIKGVYQGEVTLADPAEPERFVLRARGQGAPGTVEATVLVRLSEVDGGTRVDYDAEAVVGGMIGGVGQRMLGSVAKKTAGEFFSAVERHLLSGPAAGGLTPEVAQPADVDRAAPQVFTRPAETLTPVRQGVPAWSLLAAFGMGAGISLGSAVIGWVLGRQRSRR
ncbi:carbon monoxide dehydrogenase subunit G [Planotetraspora sp. A-T 1434]|uniref:SRPBCC family protein n=1 Tax=Planotetraspora sp. A-T 1434 TaxID=2979219 RepID=UPI0021C17F76|nr:carbon monoxide dehydrogenase subunit G [Planotetraspora sp. A-T 1434]MCT9929420.1 carbon monoxide dehydrogenase subunit G [Planotetraspora sp. A-T 1434]